MRGGRWPVSTPTDRQIRDLIDGDISLCARSCRHRPFRFTLGDQASSSHALAVGVALYRVSRGRGRQRVTRHSSPYRSHPIWFVQDVDDTAAVTRR